MCTVGTIATMSNEGNMRDTNTKRVLSRSVAATLAAGALMLSASGMASAASSSFLYKEHCLAYQTQLENSGWAVITKYCYKNSYGSWSLEWRE